MKETAIIALLWGTHTPILLEYLSHTPGKRNVFLLKRMADENGQRQDIEALGAKVYTLEQPVTADEKQRIHQNQKDVQTRLDTTLKHCQPFLDAHGSPLLIPFAETAHLLSQTVMQHCSDIHICLTWLQRIQREFFVELIVSSEDVMSIARTIMLWGKQAGIPSLHIQHSAGMSRPPPIHSQYFADHMAVYGIRSLQAYANFPAQHISITGNPCWQVYTQYAMQKTTVRNLLAQTYALKPDQPLLVFGTTWAPRLSAHTDLNSHRATLNAMLHAFRLLKTRHIDATLVIKDREANAKNAANLNMIAALAAQHGFTEHDYVYTTEDLEPLIIAADVLISSDSSLSIEAMHVQTPAINLDTEWVIMLGHAFHAEDGILSVSDYDAKHLSDTIAALLTDKILRQAQQHKMRQHVSLYNATAYEGNALTNAANVMRRIARQPDAANTHA